MKIMIWGTLNVLSWKTRAQIWKLVFLQRPDGSWALTPELALAILPSLSSEFGKDIENDAFNVVIEAMPKDILSRENMRPSPTDTPGSLTEMPSKSKLWATALAVAFLKDQECQYYPVIEPIPFPMHAVGRLWLLNTLSVTQVDNLIDQASLLLDQCARRRADRLGQQKALEEIAMPKTFMERSVQLVAQGVTKYRELVTNFIKAYARLVSKPMVVLDIGLGWTGILMFHIWFYYSKSMTCCSDFKHQMCDDGDDTTPCFLDDDDESSSYSDMQPTCGEIMETWGTDYECMAFPNKTVIHRVWSTIISLCVMFPLCAFITYMANKCFSAHIQTNRFENTGAYLYRFKRRLLRRLPPFFKHMLQHNTPSSVTYRVNLPECRPREPPMSIMKLSLCVYGLVVSMYMAMAFIILVYSTMLYNNVAHGAQNDVLASFMRAIVTKVVIQVVQMCYKVPLGDIIEGNGAGS
eukprot:TRINITY_DN2219_c0_g1::TRINITY_DN2219_c0_g1_i2::g.6652::m.6652 TRINITY_DN2219_c0_g1::TRINITY_DN2219_c0_g1_i2::g.6652  ORF type:complete len:465 (+),score=120.47 TRINITY_DN2219_c0_g1_i2:2-1396(+)